MDAEQLVENVIQASAARRVAEASIMNRNIETRKMLHDMSTRLSFVEQQIDALPREPPLSNARKRRRASISTVSDVFDILDRSTYITQSTQTSNLDGHGPEPDTSEVLPSQDGTGTLTAVHNDTPAESPELQPPGSSTPRTCVLKISANISKGLHGFKIYLVLNGIVLSIAWGFVIQLALQSDAYAYFQMNATRVWLDVILKLLDYITFYYFYSCFMALNAPRPKKQDRKSLAYKARTGLANDRRRFLQENGYPQRYCDLIQPQATSDDELDESGQFWLVKRRPERSVEAEHFIRILDLKREQYGRQQGEWTERIRIVPTTNQQISSFMALPDAIPVDYFNPTFFNELQPAIRRRISVAKIALLPFVANSLTWNFNERLQDSAFTRKYGQRVFAKYYLPIGKGTEVDNNDAGEITDDESDISIDELFSGSSMNCTI